MKNLRKIGKIIALILAIKKIIDLIKDMRKSKVK